MQDENQVETSEELAAQLQELRDRLQELERESAVRRRVQILSIGALYAVMAALLILHWAGHVMRHG